MARPKKIPACTNCGSRATMRSGYGWGAIKVMHDDYGRQFDIDTARVNYTGSTVVRCAGCKKVRRDVKLPTTNIERK